eukprot:UN27115
MNYILKTKFHDVPSMNYVLKTRMQTILIKNLFKIIFIFLNNRFVFS